MTQWRASFLLLAAVAACLCVLRPLEAANVDVVLENGVYKNLVLGVKQGTAQPNDSDTFITELQSFLDAGSAALHFATEGRASFGGVTLLLPRDWDTTRFSNVAPASPGVSLSSADILLHDDEDTVPDTLQAELCGVPGRQVRIPLPFLSLTAEEEKQYGTTGSILAHEWAHYRWGVHDEHGYPGDPVYPGLQDPDDMSQTPSSCAVGPIEGGWHPTCDDPRECNPQTNSADCKFCFSDTSTAANTQASLGYLPALSLGTFCNSSNHDSESLTPQNVLCGNRSVWEVIAAHPDHAYMSEHDVTAVTIALQEEPLGRVLILLDTPPTTGPVLDYTNLLDEIKLPLTTHKNLQLAIASYSAKGEGEVELVNTQPFGVIEDYGTLYGLLPTPEESNNVPDLSLVLQKALEELMQDEYLPGTMIVLPVSNRLMNAAKLDDAIGNALHIRRIKPLLLFPEPIPSLAPAGSFLQQSGARFQHSNATAGPTNYASAMAAKELEFFVSQPFTNDHAIVLHGEAQLEVGDKYSGTVLYQENVVHHRLAVITSTGPVSELNVYYNKYGMMRLCDTCTVTDDSVFFRLTAPVKTNYAGEEWILEVINNGNDVVDIKITWSEVNYVGVPEEMEVAVWSSEGRGPIANVWENAEFVLYASVTNFGKQVLGSRITVVADLMLGGTYYPRVPLLDDGAGSDIRRDDSVYSHGFNRIDIPNGTVVTIKNVYVSSNIPYTSYNARPAVAGNSKQSLASSGLYTTDPDDQDCCGSFVLTPNVDLSHRVNGYNVYLWGSIPPIEIHRTINAEPTTTAEPTTAEPTTAKPTTAEPTTAELTTAELTTAEPTTAEPTTAEPTTAEPTTAELTTAEPTTAEPTTAEPTTAEPTTAEPTTAEATTAKPTTEKPTTEKPTTEKPTTPKLTTEEQTTTTDGVGVSAVASAGFVLSIVGLTLALTTVY